MDADSGNQSTRLSLEFLCEVGNQPSISSAGMSSLGGESEITTRENSDSNMMAKTICKCQSVSCRCKTTSANRIRLYECKICLKQFSSKGLLHTHLQVHVEQTYFLCDFCEQSFKSKALRINHVTKCHKDKDATGSNSLFEEALEENEEQFKCAACSALFSQLKQLFTHLQGHTNEDEIAEIKQLEDMLKISRQKPSSIEDCTENRNIDDGENVDLNRDVIRKDNDKSSFFNSVKSEVDCEVVIENGMSQDVIENGMSQDVHEKIRNESMKATAVGGQDKDRSFNSDMNITTDFEEAVVKQESRGKDFEGSDSDFSNLDEEFNIDTLNESETSGSGLPHHSTSCSFDEQETQKSKSTSCEKLINPSKPNMPHDLDLQNSVKVSESNSGISENETEVRDNDEMDIEEKTTNEFMSGMDSSKVETEALVKDELSQKSSEIIHSFPNQNATVLNIEPQVEISTGKTSTGKGGDKQYRCIHCDKVFAQRRYFMKHWKAIHEKNKGVPCTMCSKSFVNPYELKDHMATHSDVRTFFCEYCGKGFKRKSHLDEHVRIHTGEKPYKCQKCPAAFNSGKQLKVHDMMEHTGIKPFCCDICGKTFTRNSILKDHMRTHSDKRDYECDICGKTYKLKSALSQHRKATHLGKTYECEFCKKRFTSNKSLNLHIQRHKDEHECEFCKKRFTSNYNMKLHIQRHKDERPFKCLICSSRFYSKLDVKVHIRSKHKGVDFVKNFEKVEILSEEGDLVKEIKTVRTFNVKRKDEKLGKLAQKKQNNTSANETVTENQIETSEQDLESVPKEDMKFTNDEITLTSDTSLDEIAQECQPPVVGYHREKTIPKEGFDFISDEVIDNANNIERKETIVNDGDEVIKDTKTLESKETTVNDGDEVIKDTKTIKSKKTTVDDSDEVIKDTKTIESKKTIVNDSDEVIKDTKTIKSKETIVNDSDEVIKDTKTIESKKTTVNDGDEAIQSEVHEDLKSEPAVGRDPKDEESVCGECGEVFVTAEELIDHMLIHRPFICTYCNKGFKQKTHLIEHIRIHTGEKPYKCTKCTMAFSYSKSLKIHDMEHTGIRPHGCDICGKTFTRRTILNEHILSHSDKRTFQCDTCGKSWKYKRSLRLHNKTPCDTKSPQCSECGKEFRSKVYLSNHKCKPKRKKDEEMEEILRLCEEKVKRESEDEDM